MAILAFQKPDKVIMLEADSKFGKFEFRPLEPGYGITVGNALRRILLSSLEGFTFPGSIFLAIVAVMPSFAVKAGVSAQFAQFYGGTSLLILVGVVLDTLQQIESHLLMRHYDGLMKSGRVKGRTGAVSAY